MYAVSTDFLKQIHGFDNHARVFALSDAPSGLEGYIAIHTEYAVPTVGGTRMYQYPSKEAALEDALRLSRAMTYKCALAGLKHGGAKAVIIGDPAGVKNQALLLAYAHAVKELGGVFFTGEDVGMSEEDVQYMLTVCPYFIGRSGAAGDPSPFAAVSTLYALQVAVEKRMGKKSLAHVSVAVKGVGKVGSRLVSLLKEHGAEVVIADINPDAVEKVTHAFPTVTVASPAEIHRQRVDVYAPCALGNEFTKKTAEEIHAGIICGAANNQLADDAVGVRLHRRHILYIPDYIANAGGLIDVADELEEGGYHRARVFSRIESVKRTVADILDVAEREGKPTNSIADGVVLQMLEKAHALSGVSL